MKIHELFENQPLPYKELKQLITSIRKGVFSANNTPIKFGNYKIEDGMVVKDGAFNITSGMLPKEGEFKHKLPFKMKRSGQIVISSIWLSSFEGFPETVTNSGDREYGGAAIVATSSLIDLTSLEGISRKITGNLRLEGLINLKPISHGEKYFDYIDGYICLPSRYVGPLLWLLKIPKLKSLDMGYLNDKSFQVTQIINKYIKEGKQDIISCQEELIDAGFGKYAKL